MKNKRDKGLLAKALTGFLAVMLVIGGIYLAGADVKYVQAETDQGTVVVLEDKTIDYKVKRYSDISNYRTKDTNGNFTAPTLTTAELTAANDATKGEWLFAGWFTDKDCTKALSSGTVFTNKAITGTYYAKFVSADVLSIKCQVGADIMKSPEYTVLRCISTVDSLAYRGIGLRLVTPDGTVRKMDNNKVNTRIQAREVSEGVVADAYSYSPKVVDTESEYFFSATEVINAEDFDKEYIVKPYWITKDGTQVWGVSRCVSVNEAINKDATYIPVKMSETAASSATLIANDGTDNHTLTYSGKYDADTGYAHFKLTTDLTSLKSLTNYTITGSGVSASYAYRNLKTKVTGIITGVPTSSNGTDQSWYTVANGLGEDEFIIATDADFYGLAEVVNNQTDLFKNKTIYLVSDIKVNEGYAHPNDLKWTTEYAEDGITKITNGTAREWNKIGSESTGKRFAGTFDGQMHSISGIYRNTNSSYIGLFGGTDSTAVIKNLRLLNSFFYTSGTQLGSIVANAMGEFNTIYSEAVLKSAGETVGGLIGSTSSSGGVTMTNCWFNGSLTNNTIAKNYYGGLIGRIQKTSTLSNCLNTGNIILNVSKTPRVGGVVGWISSDSTISNCLNMGEIGVHAQVTSYYALLIGNDSSSNTQINNTYSTSQGSMALVSVGTSNSDSKFPTSAQVGAESDIAGEKALTTSAMTSLFTTTTAEGTTESYWAIVPGKGPALASFAETVYGSAQPVDTSWKDAAGTESDPYLIKDMADFYGLAMLSKSNTFAGKHIKLTADISTKNTGNAADWGTSAQLYEWIGIGDATSVFAGNFDGQGHEISGIYINSMSGENQGLFRSVDTEGVIKDFRLRNSYIGGTATKTGSIAGLVAAGTFDSIFSDVTVVSTTSDVGGLIGNITGAVTMNNCWFKGTVTNTQQVLGGLIGRVNASGMTVTIKNCLNSGSVYTSKSHNYAYAGGLVGYDEAGVLDVKFSLNTGTIDTPNAAGRRGLIVGYLKDNVASISRNQVYSVKDEEIGTANVSGTFEANEIYGTGAMSNMPKFFTDSVAKGYWSVVTGKTPVLTTFIEYATDETEASDLHKAIANADNTKYLIAEAGNPISLEASDYDSKSREGGCIDKDGRYYYQAFLTNYNSFWTAQQEGDNAEVVIAKFDLTGEEEVKYSAKLKMAHSNDMTYNSNTKQIIVCHARGNERGLTILNAATLEKVGGKEDIGFAFHGIDYNAANDCYVVYTGSTHYCYILNANFEPIMKYESKNVRPDVEGTLSPQGMGCDDKYIYYLYAWSGDAATHEQIISVIDWNGNHITNIRFSFDEEAETIIFMNNKIYVNVLKESKLYELNIQ